MDDAWRKQEYFQRRIRINGRSEENMTRNCEFGNFHWRGLVVMHFCEHSLSIDIHCQLELFFFYIQLHLWATVMPQNSFPSRDFNWTCVCCAIDFWRDICLQSSMWPAQQEITVYVLLLEPIQLCTKEHEEFLADFRNTGLRMPPDICNWNSHNRKGWVVLC